jgi:TPR repeat protein
VKNTASLAGLIAALVPVIAFCASGKGTAAFEAGRYEQAIKLLTPEAEAGDAQAQYYLAYSLRFSLPRPRTAVRSDPSELDPAQQKIHHWFEKAALAGHAQSMREYALDFDSGAGVAPDFDKALEWMQKSFDAGDRGARNQLIRWYDSGHIVKPSYAKFRELDAANADSNARMRGELQQYAQLFQAAQKYVGASDAMLQTNDPAAAADGDPRAARRLAEAATYNKDPAQQDCAAAQRYYLLAGDAGDPLAYRDLAVQFYRGHCQAQDFARARELFLKAAEGADKLAVYDLAELNLFGHGQAPDYAAAYYWLKILEALDPAWLRHEPAMLAVAQRRLQPAELAAANARVAAQAPAMAALQKRTEEKVARRPIKSAGDAASPSAWSYDLTLVDESGLCTANVRGNCDYVPFDTRLAIRNPTPTSLDCKLKLIVRRLGEKEPVSYQRRYVVFPQDTLAPKIGTVAGRVDVQASGLECTAVANPSVADNTCAMRMQPGTDIEDFLKGSAARKKRQAGRVALDLMFSELSGKPANVTIKQSSGFAELDEVGVKYARATSFRTNCVNAPMPLAIAVE